MTLGVSELGFAARKKCRICGHQLSLHYGMPAPQGVSYSAPPGGQQQCLICQAPTPKLYCSTACTTEADLRKNRAAQAAAYPMDELLSRARAGRPLTSVELASLPRSVRKEHKNAQLAAPAGGYRDPDGGGGGWWTNPAVFRSLGASHALSVSGCRYVGGWPGYTKIHRTTNLLHVDKKGVSLRSFSDLFTIPWAAITDIEVMEGLKEASRRTTPAVVIVHVRSGEQAYFEVERTTSDELHGKLAPVIHQLHRAKQAASSALDPAPAPPRQATSARPAPPQSPGPMATAPAMSVADELKKLADLRDAGILTAEEFNVQKVKLLSQ